MTEIRLRSALEATDRQRTRAVLSEDEIGQRLTQKTAELQLLQRRVRDEAKAKVDGEQRRADGLERQLNMAKQVNQLRPVLSHVHFITTHH